MISAAIASLTAAVFGILTTYPIPPVTLLRLIEEADLLGQQRPRALEKMVAYRSSIQTAKLNTRTTYYTGFASRNGEPRTVFKTVQIAGDRHLYTDHGDDQGIVIRSISGGASPVHGYSPKYRLELPTESWRRSENAVIAHRFVHPPRRFGDMRTLGVSSVIAMGDIHDIVWDDGLDAPAAREYEESRDGDLHVVKVRASNFTRTYWLDPARGWSPVRVREEYQDGNWSESRTTLDLMDGVWFPKAVYTFSSHYQAGQEPTTVLQIDSPEFNRPDHPTTFTLPDIGVDVGLVVFDYETKPSTSGRWDGEKITTHADYAKRVAAGDLRDSPQYTALLDRLAGRTAVQAVSKPGVQRSNGISVSRRTSADGQERRADTDDLLSHHESDWEAYTRRFIEKYKLAGDQEQKALSILKSCEQQGKKYLGSRKTSFDRLARRTKELTDSEPKDKAKQLAALAEERAKLRKPIDDIFEKQLKPRLDKLPTRAQRAAAEKSAQQKPPGKREANRGGRP